MVLAINVQVQQDRELRFFTIPLLTLTGLLFQWWVVSQTITGWRLKISDLAAALVELVEAFGMASLVFWNMFEVIGKSLWYGMTPTWAN